MSAVFEPDKSGINSLGGFSYQIKVFIYYLSKLKKDMQLEFEVYDDVSLSKVDKDTFDDNEEKFKSLIKNSIATTAIQVKRTDISKETAQKILLNWILIESSGQHVSEYILLTDESYKNKDILFKESAKDLYDLVVKTTKSKKAVIRKVKDLYKDNYESFNKVYASIEKKYSFVEKKDLDEEIADAYETLFKRHGVSNEVVYFQRIKALLEKVINDTMECVSKKNPYIMTYATFMKLTERISVEISDANPVIDYISFKRSCSIDIEDIEIAKLREFKQLNFCELPTDLIRQHLIYGFYYNHFRFTYSEMNKITQVENVEETAYENYLQIKHILKRSGRDTPINRLEKTQSKENSYANNEQVKYGVVIHLTKDDMGDRQISWKEEKK